MRQLSTDPPLMLETAPSYVEVLTRNQAIRRRQVRIYDVSDLLHFIPHFNNAPELDMQNALSNTSNGGTSSSASIIVFTENSNLSERRKTRTQFAEELTDLIRDTIEPDIWLANGGQYASIEHFRGRLVVKAPAYIHRQIRFSRVKAAPSAPGPNRHATNAINRRPLRYRSDGVSGVQRIGPAHVAGVSRRP